jgi:ergothioneine biosynthesis protein EgtB
MKTSEAPSSPAKQSAAATGQAADPDMRKKYARVRAASLAVCAPLEMDDYGVQTAPEVSPLKWHLAHSSWFFETLVLQPYLPGYQVFHPAYAHLFNSYYNTLGSFHPQPERGMLSRPTLADVQRYRAHVDEHMARLLASREGHHQDDIRLRTQLGLEHEQQHQELMLMDIKHIFFYNPLHPVYRNLAQPQVHATAPLRWIGFAGGVQSIGHAGQGFAYDNEGPRHKVYLNPYQLAARPVTNGEFIAFMDTGAYGRAEYWLSDAWKMLQQKKWQAPLYWERRDDRWWHMTLGGMRPVDVHAPVCHVSYYEAAAYAQWAGVRLPTEAEWEVAATDLPIAGNLRDTDLLQPMAATGGGPLQQMFGDVWEWTQSAYAAYPGYRAQAGPLGEYNGKFMSGQLVLRGGACVTPAEHMRATYRNFFYPWDRWQFSGLRLARDAQ